MLIRDAAFSGFSVDDIEKARAFYADVLGLPARIGEMGMLEIGIGGGKNVLAYPKPDHQAATYTCLNIPTDDIDGAVRDLKGSTHPG